MHQMSLGLFLDKGGAFVADGTTLRARDGAILTDTAGSVLTNRTTRTSDTGIALISTTQIDLTGKDV